MKVGDPKRTKRVIRKAIAPVLKEMCEKPYKRNEIYETNLQETRKFSHENLLEDLMNIRANLLEGDFAIALKDLTVVINYVDLEATNSQVSTWAVDENHAWDGAPGEWGGVALERKSKKENK